jgi:hypothetical protein
MGGVSARPLSKALTPERKAVMAALTMKKIRIVSELQVGMARISSGPHCSSLQAAAQTSTRSKTGGGLRAAFCASHSFWKLLQLFSVKITPVGVPFIDVCVFHRFCVPPPATPPSPPAQQQVKLTHGHNFQAVGCVSPACHHRITCIWSGHWEDKSNEPSVRSL